MHPFHTFHYCPKCGSSHFFEYNFKAYRCEECGFIYYFNPSTATVAIICNDKKELLVACRANDPAKGTLDLPGGFVDMEESAEEGVAREVKEETGLTVLKTRFLFSIPNTYLYSDFLVHTTDLFFLCDVDSCASIEAHDDVAELSFVPLNQIQPENFGLLSVRKGIERILNESLFGEE